MTNKFEQFEKELKIETKKIEAENRLWEKEYIILGNRSEKAKKNEKEEKFELAISTYLENIEYSRSNQRMNKISYIARDIERVIILYGKTGQKEKLKNFLEENNLLLVSSRLQKASIFYGDFDCAKSKIKKGDLVFLDPPYTVSHNNNGFIKYNQKLFSLDDQIRLSELINYIKGKDAYYILTNAAHSKVLEIFEKGDSLYTMKRASLIGGINAERGKISEYIFSNIKND